MDSEKIQAALVKIAAEPDPTVKCLNLASLCTAVWREHGVPLVVVGGSAIEILTEGAYTSGDLDLCHTTPAAPPLRERQELMGRLGGEGGPRSWKVAGMYVDLLGQVEAFARTPFRRIQGPFGEVQVMKPEDLLVERVLVAVYPGENQAARECAKKLAAVLLTGEVQVDWAEVKRVAGLREYRNVAECAKLVEEVANEIGRENPLHSD
jgi:hypothetical protein